MADSGLEVDHGSEKRTKKKKKTHVEVSMVQETPDRIAPVVGYFSSGYNPSDSSEPPQVRVFRNKYHRSSHLDVVVKPKDSEIEFVGKSYKGEAEVSQPCQYALGIFDKDTQKLKVVQIAAGKIFRLEPRLMERAEEPPEGLEVAEKTERRMSDLTSLYGTKKQKNWDKRMNLLRQQTYDPSARGNLEDELLDAADMNNEALEDTKATSGPSIPPHDLSADTPEKAYLLDEIIAKGEREYLFDILDLLHSGGNESATFWEENYYPSFVANRVPKLKQIKDEEEKKKQAYILSYITHLVNFWKLAGSRRAKIGAYGDAINKYKIPRIVYQKFAGLFLDPASNVLSTEKKELIIGYILVLTLFFDNFSTRSSDIASDLGMADADLSIYFKQLGCRKNMFGFGKYYWKLHVPLKSATMMKRKRQQRR